MYLSLRNGSASFWKRQQIFHFYHSEQLENLVLEMCQIEFHFQNLQFSEFACKERAFSMRTGGLSVTFFGVSKYDFIVWMQHSDEKILLCKVAQNWDPEIKKNIRVIDQLIYNWLVFDLVTLQPDDHPRADRSPLTVCALLGSFYIIF